MEGIKWKGLWFVLKFVRNKNWTLNKEDRSRSESSHFAFLCPWAFLAFLACLFLVLAFFAGEAWADPVAGAASVWATAGAAFLWALFLWTFLAAPFFFPILFEPWLFLLALLACPFFAGFARAINNINNQMTKEISKLWRLIHFSIHKSVIHESNLIGEWTL